MTTSKAKAVEELLTQIRQATDDGNYIFRGEQRDDYFKVSSSLYRVYQDEIDAGYFSIETVEEEIVSEVKKHTHEKDNNVILEQLQHYGGKTNQIDFSTDYLVALFFACYGDYDKDGKLIFLNKEGVKTYIPTNPQRRVIAQKSIFVRSPKGFVEPSYQVIVPSELKKYVLEYLNKYHNINTATIYNDIHGYIAQAASHKSAYTQFYRGFAHNSKGEIDKAIEEYTKAIELNPNMAEAYNNRGNAYVREDANNLAIADFSKSIELNPNYAVAYSNRGIAYSVIGKYDLAIADYNKAIELDSNDATAYRSLSMAYNNRGNTYSTAGTEEYDLAIADYNKAIEINPNDAMIYNNRGRAYGKKGNNSRAITDFNKSIELDPNYAMAYKNRGITKKVLQDHKGAKEDLETALKLEKK